MESVNLDAVDRLFAELLRPDGDLNSAPIAPDAIFVGPMVEHLDRQELIHFLHINFMRPRVEPIELSRTIRRRTIQHRLVR